MLTTRAYQARWLRADLVAGLTVTALLIPEGMAYAQLAGVPAQAAFSAAPAALLLYAVLGTSRQLVVAVSSAVAITSAAIVTELAPQGAAQYVALTAALALLAGLVSMVAGLARLGRVARFFSPSVLLGFVFGLALIISARQLPKLLGVEVDSDRFFPLIVETVVALPSTQLPTVLVSLGCLAGMLVLERVVPRVPAALVVLVGSIVVSAARDLPARGVAVVGELPAGLAAPQLPDVGWDDALSLATGALGIALLVFAEALGPGQSLAKEHGYTIDANRELVALGAANVGAGLFQGFSVGASLSKSAANDEAGARTSWSLVVAAATTALVALFLTPLFRDLPEAALGAIVVVAVSSMERVAPLRRLWRLRRADFVLAMIALLSVLVVGILVGLGIAVLASLAVVVWRASQARVEVIAETPDADAPADTLLAPAGLLLVRPQEQVFFANAAEIRDRVLGALRADHDHPSVVLVDLGLTPDLDVPALDVLTELRDRVAHHDAHLWLATQVEPVRTRLARAGLTGADGAFLFHDATEAVLAHLSLRSSPQAEEARQAVFRQLLADLDSWRAAPALDEHGRAALDAFAARVRRELDPGGGRADGPASGGQVTP